MVANYSLKLAEQIGKGLHTRADAARVRLRQKMQSLGAGVPDPSILVDLAEIGADHIYSVGLDFTKWSTRMVGELGDWVKPHLADVFKAAQKNVDDMAEKLGKATEAVKRTVKKQTPEEVKDIASKAIKDKLDKKQKNALPYYLNKLSRLLYEEGVTDREPMLDALTEIVQRHNPDMTRQEVGRAWAGYGDYRQLTKDEISVALRGMKGELQQIAKLEDMQRGEPPLKTGTERRTPTETERKLIKLVNDAKNKFQIPITDPDRQLKSPLDTLKTAYQNRITDLQDRMARGDFAPRPRRQIELDPAAQRLKAEAERVKKQFRARLLAERLKNRSLWEKGMDLLTQFRRANVLSSPVVIPKLVSAGIARLSSMPTEDALGGVWAHVPGVSKIAERAPLEGAGLNLRAEMRGFGSTLTRGMQDAYQVFKTGHSDLDVLYGKVAESYTGEFEYGSHLLGFFGRVHGMIKSPVKRAAFERAAQRIGEWEARQGNDPHDPVVMARITAQAYKAANRSIFLSDNRIVDGVQAMIRRWEAADKATGKPTVGGKTAAVAARVALPIMRVPANIVAETMQYAFGLASGSARAAVALARGVEKLPPEHADLIMRELKKGSIGGALLLVGFFSPNAVGGYYRPNQKRDPKAVQFGDIRLFGHEIPSYLLHNPLLETIQFGATIRQVADSKLRKRDTDPQGIPAATVAAMFGLLDEVPFVRESSELNKLRDPYQRAGFAGEFAKSVAVPAALQKVAQWTDPAEKRRPTTLWQHIETGIPGLRQNVPGSTPSTDSPFR